MPLPFEPPTADETRAGRLSFLLAEHCWREASKFLRALDRELTLAPAANGHCATAAVLIRDFQSVMARHMRDAATTAGVRPGAA